MKCEIRSCTKLQDQPVEIKNPKISKLKSRPEFIPRTFDWIFIIVRFLKVNKKLEDQYYLWFFLSAFV